MPDNTIRQPLSASDFADAGASALLAAVPDDRDWAPCLHLAAGEAAAAGEDRRACVLGLLARACALRLEPEEKAPFQDEWLAGEVVAADAFHPDEIVFFAAAAAAAVPASAPAPLRARLADLAWLYGRDRRNGVALCAMAIDAYRMASIDTEQWHDGGREAWLRALQLAVTAGQAGAERAAAIEAELLAAFDKAEDVDGYAPLWFIEPLMLTGQAKEHAGAIAARLHAIADARRRRGSYHEAAGFYPVARQWYARADDAAGALAMLISLGACHEAHGDAEGMGAMALIRYERAIQTLCEVPGRQRTAHRINERIDALRHKLREAGLAATEQIQPLSPPPVDVTELANRARAGVAGHSALSALLVLARAFPAANERAARAAAHRAMEQSVLGGLTDTRILFEDGRVDAKIPAQCRGSSAKRTDKAIAVARASNEKRLLAAMVDDFTFRLQLAVNGAIVPALHIVWREHALRRADFTALAEGAAVVPPGRADLVGRALHAGYAFDFIGALHLLVPQTEHLVRYHLRQAGAQTTKLTDGIDQENGLSTLVSTREMADVFGADLAFEIRALFCHHNGPNLRNALAHGLLDASGGDASVYAWWLLLRLVLTPFRNGGRQAPPERDPAGAIE